MEGIKGAIFDLDGTLLDSLWVWAEIDKRFLGKRGISVPPSYAESISAMNFFDAAVYTIGTFGLNEQPEALMAEWLNMARDIYANEIKLKEGAKELLVSLKNRGVKLGIATSSAKDLYLSALKSNGIHELFDAIADTSGTLNKAFPDVFLRVADMLKVKPSECAVFEDLPVALNSAQIGGFKTVAVYDIHTTHELEADYKIKSFTELKGIFY